jgi:carbamoyl-phosphate synthase large subunit
VLASLSQRTPGRLVNAAHALRVGLSVERICQVSGFDPWFMERLAEIVAAEERVRDQGLPADAEGLRALKAMGFSDARLAKLTGAAEAEVAATRRGLGVRPVFKRIDTCAAEFDAKTPYMYSTYAAPAFGLPEDESRPRTARRW